MRLYRLRVARTLLLGMLPLLVLAEQVRAQQPHVGAPAAEFELQDMQGLGRTFHPGQGSVEVILFFSTRCPLSNAFNYRRNVLYQDFHNEAQFLLVDPNANESLAEVKEYAERAGFDLPVYRDIDGRVAEQLGVRATTDTFILDRRGVMRYRGNIEDSPNPERATQHGLRSALGSVLSGNAVAIAETRAIGCAVRRNHPDGQHP